MIHLSNLCGWVVNYKALRVRGIVFCFPSTSNESGQGYWLQGLVVTTDPSQGFWPGKVGGHALCWVYVPPPQATVH